MDPTLEKQQDNQDQQKQSGGGIINATSNLAGRFKNPFRITGSRIVIQAGSRVIAFLFTTPAGWAIVAIGIIVVFTLAIILPLGLPSFSTNEQTPNPPTEITTPTTAAPTETLTPAPAAP